MKYSDMYMYFRAENINCNENFTFEKIENGSCTLYFIIDYMLTIAHQIIWKQIQQNSRNYHLKEKTNIPQ